MLKSRNILYLFDFDGTLCGDTNWKGLIHNTKQCITSGTYINPNEDFGVRWSVLTGRPRIDKPFVYLVCLLRGMEPEKIFTLPRIFYSNTTYSEVIKYKVDTIKSIIDGTHDEINFDVDKIYYVDNDIEGIKKMNSMTNGYPFNAISTFDFRAGEFQNYL
jgi:hypothetical protein